MYSRRSPPRPTPRPPARACSRSRVTAAAGSAATCAVTRGVDGSERSLATSTSMCPLRDHAAPSARPARQSPSPRLGLGLTAGGASGAYADAPPPRPAFGAVGPVGLHCPGGSCGHAARAGHAESPMAQRISRATRSGPWMSRTGQARTPRRSRRVRVATCCVSYSSPYRSHSAREDHDLTIPVRNRPTRTAKAPT